MSKTYESDTIEKIIMDRAERDIETEKRICDNKKLEKKIQKDLKKISRDMPIYNKFIPGYVDEMGAFIHYAKSAYSQTSIENASICEKRILQDVERGINLIYATINRDHNKNENINNLWTRISLIVSQILLLFKS